jgi:hypothetical protein
MRISPDRFDELLDASKTRVLYQMQSRHERDNADLDPRLALLHQINEEAQRDGGQAGTHAYEMIAAVEEINAGNTETLIQLIAAIVMVARNDNPLLDQLTVSFTPHDIDEMQKAWEMTANRDGYMTTVTLTRKPEAGESWLLDADEDPTGAKEQAQQQPERPVWAVRAGDGSIHGYPVKGAAQHAIYGEFRSDQIAKVENRWCLHPDCPAERCNQEPEVASDVQHA